MFAVKNAIAEVLLKHQTVEEAIRHLDDSEKEMFAEAFQLIKSKLDGSYDEEFMKAFFPSKKEKERTIDYSEFNKPRPKPIDQDTPTIDYSDTDIKVKKPWTGAQMRREKALEDKEDAGKERTAAEEMKWRQQGGGIAKFDEEDEKKVKELKAKYRAEEAKSHPDPAKQNTKLAIRQDKVKKQPKQIKLD